MKAFVLAFVSALAASCAASSNPGAIFVDELHSADGTSEVRIRTSGIVVVTGSHVHREADGSTSLTSAGSGREVEVWINPFTKTIDSKSEDYRDPGSSERTASSDQDPDDQELGAAIRDSLGAIGGVDFIQARTATIGARSEAGYIVVLHDALMHHACRATPVVTVSWSARLD